MLITPDSAAGCDVGAPDPLVAAATALTSGAAADPDHPPFVIVVRPTASDHQVLAAGAASVLRAALSVAVAAGNDRMWAAVSGDDTTEIPLRAFPEVVRAAADGAGVTAAHVGVIRAGGQPACVAMWFETVGRIVGRAQRHSVLQLLATAAERSDAHRAEQVRVAAAIAAATEPVVVEAGPDLPAASRAELEQSLADFDGDQAALVLVAIDGYEAVEEVHGPDASSRLDETMIARLRTVCTPADLVARVDDGRFAIFVREADRSSAIQLGRRLPGFLAEPLPPDIGPTAVTASVAVSHEDGLVDAEEMFESALYALARAQGAGHGRMVLAA